MREYMRERIDLLDWVQFFWEPPLGKATKTWMGMFNELAIFHKEHGHCCVPQGKKVLYKWCRIQRYINRRIGAAENELKNSVIRRKHNKTTAKTNASQDKCYG